eukprot:CAMPEP_0113873098 /NCGR_PEP_ID=MMETSP0780_2-20120614/3579_1 /TAXON_ID=652834 /ORGANISM="Palpitomonas bilix" /LENGTH=333 /DNA_ID=CAMNT_0000858701 /DNA_START=137 /DNA_END=1138 /DNA_ORIENTATION=+ /assembly_acc=CAM_ASM_000599
MLKATIAITAAAIGLAAYLLSSYSDHAYQVVREVAPRSHDDDGWYFKSPYSGVWLYAREWRAEGGAPRGVVFIAHGMNEHCSKHWILHAADALTLAGYDVLCHDGVGSGFSDGEKGYFRRHEEVVEDFAYFVQTSYRHNTTEASRKNVFFLGHSLGTQKVIVSYMRERFAAISNIRACLLSAPAIMPHPDMTNPILVAIAGIASSLFPKLPVVDTTGNDLTVHDEDFIRTVEDPLIYSGRMRARVGAEMLDSFNHFQDGQLANFDLPFLILHGTEDTITAVEGAHKLMKEAGTKKEHKELVFFEGAKHEVFSDRYYSDTAVKKTIELFAKYTL